LSPLLDGLRELTTNYGTTVVLATATQPTFHVVHPAFGPGEDCNESIPVFGGLDGAVREIVPDAPRYFAQLKRVDYDIRTATPLSWDDVAALMRREHQALAIVNVKRHALDLLAALGDPDALHLSTRLCGAHRTVVLDEVRRRLAAGEPCRLVSTQVVEAGVDIDFPLVLRARGPLDSIIQAAGRCNREGRLAGLGRVIVFTPLDERMPQGYYATAAGISASLLAQGRDLSDHAVAQEYYQRLYEVIPPDREGIQALREGLDYPGVAEKCRLIKDNTESVIITAYGSEEEQANVQEWIALIKQQDPDSRTILRKLQPFIVSMPWYIAAKYRELIEPLLPDLGIWRGNYDGVRGIVLP
jgi:CRISPR-associated endonuclease/helicase Cas3